MRYIYECKRCGERHTLRVQVDSVYCNCAWQRIEATLVAEVSAQDLSDLTSLITVDTGSRRYYYRLGCLHYSRHADGHMTRHDVVGATARNAIKALIDQALGYNCSMPESNEAAIANIRAIFG